MNRNQLRKLLGLKSDAAALPAQARIARAGTEKLDPSARIVPDPASRRYIFLRPPNDAGGFVTGFDIASNGTDFVCWTDVFNAYVRRGGDAAWQQLLTAESLLPEEYDPRPQTERVGWGAFAARFAPSDPNLIYTAWNALLFRVENGEARRTILPPKMFLISGPNRRFSDTIAVHAEDKNLVLVGTQGDGCYASKDGFTETYVQLDLPPAGKDLSGENGKYLVAFHGDEAFVHVFGVGLYRFPQGPFGPSVFVGRAGDGEPVNASCMKVTPHGDVWVCRYRGGENETPEQKAARGLWRYRAGEWKQFSNSGHNPDQVAIDPFDEKRILVTDEDTQFWYLSTDGETFDRIGNEYRGAGEVAWLSNRVKAMYPSKVEFHPLERGVVVISDGVGMTMAKLPEADTQSAAGDCIAGIIAFIRSCFGVSSEGPPPGTQFIVHDFSRGIFEMVSTCGISKAGQPDVIVGCMDKPVWRVRPDMGLTGEWSYCEKDADPQESAVSHLRSIDDAIDDPNFLAGLFHQSNSVPGYSEDWGSTWTPFGKKPDGSDWLPGGCIAVSNRDTMLFTEANNGGLWRTADGGQSWHPVGFGGVDQVTRMINAYYVHRKCIAADKQRPGTFSVLMNMEKQPNSEASLGGLWFTRNGGRTFEQRFEGALREEGKKFEPYQFWQCRLEYVPDHPGELLYASCTEKRDEENLLWSRDDGRSWINLPAYRMSSWAFGKGTGERPAIFFHGFYEGVKGWYVTYDWFDTPPVLISRFPGGIIDSVGHGLSLVGDMNTVGRAALGFGGNSWLFCEEVSLQSPSRL